MATIPTTSKLSPSTSSGTDEENKISYETNLSAEDTILKLIWTLVLGLQLIRKSYNT